MSIDPKPGSKKHDHDLEKGKEKQHFDFYSDVELFISWT